MRGGERKVKEKEKKKAALRQRQQLTEVVGFMSRRGRRVCPVLQSAVLQPRRRRDGGKREGEASENEGRERNKASRVRRTLRMKNASDTGERRKV